MTYNLTAVMNRAWAIVRKANVAKHGLRTILRNALQTAWREAKTARVLASLPDETDVSPAKRALLRIENKTRLSHHDWVEMSRLRGIISAQAATPAHA